MTSFYQALKAFLVRFGIAQLVLGGLCFHAAWGFRLNDAKDIEWYVKQPGAQIEEVFKRLSEKFDDHFSLPFASRSTTTDSSLELPRFLRMNPETKTVIGAAGTHSLKGGDQVELYFKDPETQELKLALARFPKNGTPDFMINPPQCMSCHARGGYIRPIWDGYPDWPGVFGQSHNGIYMEYGLGYRGFSRMPTAEYELAALERLRKNLNQPGFERYAFLKKHFEKYPKNEDLYLFLSETNTTMSNHMIDLNNEALRGSIERKLKAMPLAEREKVVRDFYQDTRLAKDFYKSEEVTLTDRLKTYPFAKEFQDATAAEVRNSEAKKTRFLELIQIHGTDADKARVTSLEATVHVLGHIPKTHGPEVMTIGLSFPQQVNASMNRAWVQELGLSSDGLSMALEKNGPTFPHEDKGQLLIYELEPILKRSAKPGFKCFNELMREIFVDSN